MNRMMIKKRIVESKNHFYLKSVCIDFIPHHFFLRYQRLCYGNLVDNASQKLACHHAKGSRNKDMCKHIQTHSRINFKNCEEPNLFEEELSKVFKEYPLPTDNKEPIDNEEILITHNMKNEIKNIGNVVKLDDSTYGMVLQINKHNVVIGKIKKTKFDNSTPEMEDYHLRVEDTSKNTEKSNEGTCHSIFSQPVKETNVYSPFEYLNYLFSNEPINHLNIFRHVEKETYHRKPIIKQLYTNLLLTDLFNKINYGQKICIIEETKNDGKKQVIKSILYENLLTNLVKKNEHFFIICSNSPKAEILNVFHELHELFRKMHTCSGEMGGEKKNSYLGEGRSAASYQEKGQHPGYHQTDQSGHHQTDQSGHHQTDQPRDKRNVQELYSKNYMHGKVKMPNDVLLINASPETGSKVSVYISPLLSLYNLNEYKKKYKNVLLIFYDVTMYSEISSNLQKDMNTFVRSYYEKWEGNTWGKSYTTMKIGLRDTYPISDIPPIATLPLSVYTVLSKYMAASKYPHFVGEVGDESTGGKYVGSEMTSSSPTQGHIGDKHVRNCRYADSVLGRERITDSHKIDAHMLDTHMLDAHKIRVNKNRWDSGVTTFCFLNKGEVSDPVKDYALSVSENNMHMLRNNFNIQPEFNLNQVIKNVTNEENKVWEFIKEDIRKVIQKRNEMILLNENKKNYNIFIDDWEYEDLIHYNSIYYILIYVNHQMATMNSFDIILFLRILLTYNFTNSVISRNHIHSFYIQFNQFYSSNSKYFSLLKNAYYQQLSSFNDRNRAHIFIRKIDLILKCINPPFRYIL
ncbi:hypothetical protein, conserved [Plasmodium gonderi]|uniref:Uncharacterized protein n=1 Tax=Plasmodium gonderi TaxID=77519 RepID=A0A1Y1JQ46_PLAGO|nr:hypothetical protein, conserved [Plasmodium gonderi]GAW82184.1 hypothetical protein, conserved [Plasmodium gonderi]